MQPALQHAYGMVMQTIFKSISLLQSHVQKFQAPGMVGSVSVVEFWLLTLCSLPNWYRSVTAVLNEYILSCISWAYQLSYLFGGVFKFV